MFRKALSLLVIVAVIGLAELFLTGCEDKSPEIDRRSSVTVSTMPVGSRTVPVGD